MTQANAISALRNEVKSLKKRLIDNDQDQGARAWDDKTGQSCASSSPFGERNILGPVLEARYLALDAIVSALASAVQML